MALETRRRGQLAGRGLDEFSKPSDVLIQAAKDQEGAVLEPGPRQRDRLLRCPVVAVTEGISQDEVTRPDQRLAGLGEFDLKPRSM